MRSPLDPRAWLRRVRRSREENRPAALPTEPLLLVPFFFPTGMGVVDALGRQLAGRLTVEVGRRPPGFDPEAAYDTRRGQYDSRRLLGELLRCYPTPGKVLGVTDVDLFIPVLTFVFGEAQLGGTVALVSTHRLDPVRYGLPADPALLQERLLKEAVHELGHTWNLRHCDDAACVMASSSVVEAIDLKSARYCRVCRERWLRVRDGAGGRPRGPSGDRRKARV